MGISRTELLIDNSAAQRRHFERQPGCICVYMDMSRLDVFCKGASKMDLLEKFAIVEVHTDDRITENDKRYCET